MSNVVELAKRGIRNEADLKRFIKNHASAEPGQMVQAINISMMLDITSSNAAHHHRLDAGRLLLELRASIEAGGDNWWQWQKGKFKRSRKDMEKMMRLARSEDPEEAFEEHLADRRAREYRAEPRGSNVAVGSSKEDGASGRSKAADETYDIKMKRILSLILDLPRQERDQLEVDLKRILKW